MNFFKTENGGLIVQFMPHEKEHSISFLHLLVLGDKESDEKIQKLISDLSEKPKPHLTRVK